MSRHRVSIGGQQYSCYESCGGSAYGTTMVHGSILVCMVFCIILAVKVVVDSVCEHVPMPTCCG